MTDFDWRAWAFSILPPLFNAILILLGFQLSLPALAQKVEDEPKKYRRYAGFCLIVGALAFFMEACDRHNGEAQIKNLREDANKTLINTNSLLTEIGNIAYQVSVLQPKIDDLAATATALDKKIEAAKGNPALIAKLEAQKQQTIRDAAAARQKLTISTAQSVAKQLTNMGTLWYGTRDALDGQNRYNTDRAPRGSPEREELEREGQRKLTDMNRQKTSEARGMVQLADNLRTELLQAVPDRTDADARATEIISKVLAGETIADWDLRTLGSYLDDLTHRVKPPQ